MPAAPAKQKTGTATLRAALYARFSSDIQKDTSIDRQFADLEKAAHRLGLKLNKRHYYSDRAQSGSSLFDRPGLTRDLLGAAERHEFDVVLVELTDRLSRNQADQFWVADRFKFHNVKIFTPMGEVSSLQLTFDAYQNADFIAKLAGRVRSGHDEMARRGLIPGRAAYGYDCVADHTGAKATGAKAINPEQAKIVVRIFEEYATGKSPRVIAADLMRDRVPSPSGNLLWNFQSIIGGLGKKRGLIQNHLYIGKYLKNRFVNVKNPSTGKVVARKADADDLIEVDVPHLRIIDQKLWDAVHALRLQRSHKKFGVGGPAQRAVIPRKQHLLSGLLKCSECGGTMIVAASGRDGRKRVACSAARQNQSCKHDKSYNLGTLTEEAIFRMHKHLTDPEFLKEKAKGKAIEAARLAKEMSGERQEVQRRYDRLDLQIKRLVTMLEDEDMPKEMMASLKAKEIERRSLEERLKTLGAETNVVPMLPQAIKAFGNSIDKLHALLQRNPDDPECRAAFANVIDSVLVHPTGHGERYEISIYARVAAIQGGMDIFPTPRTTSEVLAAEGFPRGSLQSGLIHHTRLYQPRAEHGTLILLGRWRAAA